MYRSIILSCILLLATCGDGQIGGPPVLADLSLSTAEDTPLRVSVELSAVDESRVVFSVVTPPSHGILIGDGPTFVYTPAANFFGSDSIVVTAADIYGSATATATITVTPVDDAPVANPDSFATGFDAPLTVAQATLLANDTDLDSTTLSVVTVTADSHGAPVLSGSNVVFTPEAGFTGTATFTYTISDGTANAQATVTVSVGPDGAPVAVDDAVSTEEDVTAVIPDATLLANDTDPESQTLAIIEVGSASHGTVSHTGTQITFVPAPDYHGPAGFDYTISDGFKTSVGSVVVTVGSAPVAVADTAATDEDVALILSSATLVANDSDIDGDSLVVSAVSETANSHGTVVLEGSAVTYTAAADFNGTTDFTYTVSDGNGGTATATVTVTVNPINDNPVAVADAVTATEDRALVFPPTNLTANDTDVDGDGLTVTAVAATATTHGTVTLGSGCGLLCAGTPSARGNARPSPAVPSAIDATLSVRYVPTHDYNGPADFDYTISDGHGGTATGHVTVTVVAVNDAPVVVTSLVTLAYTENDPATPVDSTVAVADVDSAMLTGATVQITTGCASAEDVLALAAPPPGITVIGYNAATCTLALDGTATTADYQAALRLVTYANTSDAPSTAARVMIVTVDDGAAVNHSGSAVRNLSVTAVDDAPSR
jgi:hypothetical protein